jgi:MSHA biogenesis protein MshJ
MAVRERVLIAVTAAVLLAAIAFVGHIEPAQKAIKAEGSALQSARAELLQARSQIEALRVRLAEDPDASARSRLQALQQELAAVDTQLEQQMGQVISPERMARLLQDLLESNKRLTLIRIASEPATPANALLGVEETAEAAPDANIPALYRHGLQIEFSGDYLSALEYLRAIEELPWRLFWDRIDLQTEDYPRVSIRLRVYTLSLSEGWIGV